MDGRTVVTRVAQVVAIALGALAGWLLFGAAAHGRVSWWLVVLTFAWVTATSFHTWLCAWDSFERNRFERSGW